MPKFIATQTLRYEVEAETLADAENVWRAFSNADEFADDVEFLDGSTEIEEVK